MLVPSSNTAVTWLNPLREMERVLSSPGMPARFAGTVKTSFRYIATGSSCFSPAAKAAEGVAGVTIASTPAKASSKSRLIRARTRCART